VDIAAKHDLEAEQEIREKLMERDHRSGFIGAAGITTAFIIFHLVRSHHLVGFWNFFLGMLGMALLIPGLLAFCKWMIGETDES
jgi:hypothetical protein